MSPRVAVVEVYLNILRTKHKFYRAVVGKYSWVRYQFAAIWNGPGSLQTTLSPFSSMPQHLPCGQLGTVHCIIVRFSTCEHLNDSKMVPIGSFQVSDGKNQLPKSTTVKGSNKYSRILQLHN